MIRHGLGIRAGSARLWDLTLFDLLRRDFGMVGLMMMPDPMPVVVPPMMGVCMPVVPARGHAIAIVACVMAPMVPPMMLDVVMSVVAFLDGFLMRFLGYGCLRSAWPCRMRAGYGLVAGIILFDIRRSPRLLCLSLIYGPRLDLRACFGIGSWGRLACCGYGLICREQRTGGKQDRPEARESNN